MERMIAQTKRSFLFLDKIDWAIKKTKIADTNPLVWINQITWGEKKIIIISVMTITLNKIFIFFSYLKPSSLKKLTKNNEKNIDT